MYRPHRLDVFFSLLDASSMFWKLPGCILLVVVGDIDVLEASWMYSYRFWRRHRCGCQPGYKTNLLYVRVIAVGAMKDFVSVMKVYSFWKTRRDSAPVLMWYVQGLIAVVGEDLVVGVIDV